MKILFLKKNYLQKIIFFENFPSLKIHLKKYLQNILFLILFLEKVYPCKTFLFLNSFSSQNIFFDIFTSKKGICKNFSSLQHISFLGFFSLQNIYIFLFGNSTSKKYLQQIFLFLKTFLLKLFFFAKDLKKKKIYKRFFLKTFLLYKSFLFIYLFLFIFLFIEVAL